jgi:hypothetical protein
VNTHNLAHLQIPESDWQILGEIELSFNTDMNKAIHLWLTEILARLNLSIDFLNKIIITAQESVAHALQSNVEIRYGHIHISVYVPYNANILGKNWGFFHIKRIGSHADKITKFEHSMDFYLYVEG